MCLFESFLRLRSFFIRSWTVVESMGRYFEVLISYFLAIFGSTASTVVFLGGEAEWCSEYFESV